ncbi:MAG: hypothetical protein R3360_02480 [Alphaproteobacteria bacterium]|nr:hypothetical protein [Alphaproteobacteria bacterium]
MDSGSENRRVLADAIRQTLSGNEVAESQFSSLISDWRELCQKEKSALLQLRNWSEDRMLRDQFARHAEYSHNRLQGLLEALEAEY